ncbi:MAG: glycosyltransferase, partial [Deltaproteobacteria bacterium]|nr:glycosyltransferase [Deltaproteobacteria bacterium]
MAPPRARLSLVFPIFDEEQNIEPLLGTAHEIASRLTPDFEIILVDDGSRDRSAEIIDTWCQQDPRFRLLRHARNTGYGAALHSGLR